MARHKINIKMQLHEQLNSLLRIGIKKTKETKDVPDWNPNRSEGIHSIQTANTYRSTINILGDFCKALGLKRIDEITREVILLFFLSRAHLSAWTQKKDLSAINKVLGTRYKSKDFHIPMRRQQDIVNNRGVRNKSSTANNPKNWLALFFVICTGCRRSSILTVTANQAFRTDEGLVIGFYFKEKGGRERIALVLPSMRPIMTNFVNTKIKEDGQNCTLIDYCDRNCNPHAKRARYTQLLYQELEDYQARGVDIYLGYREIFINEEKLQKALSEPRFQKESVQGFDPELCAEISQQIGHNRVEVTLTSYLRRS